MDFSKPAGAHLLKIVNKYLTNTLKEACLNGYLKMAFISLFFQASSIKPCSELRNLIILNCSNEGIHLKLIFLIESVERS